MPSRDLRLAPPAREAPSFAVRTIANEQAMVAVLDRPTTDLLPSEAFRRKEHELGALFVLLTPADSVELERRLSVSSSDDVLACRFARLTHERRARLIAFLRHARHRGVASRSEGRR